MICLNISGARTSVLKIQPNNRNKLKVKKVGKDSEVPKYVPKSLGYVVNFWDTFLNLWNTLSSLWDTFLNIWEYCTLSISGIRYQSLAVINLWNTLSISEIRSQISGIRCQCLGYVINLLALSISGIRCQFLGYVPKSLEYVVNLWNTLSSVLDTFPNLRDTLSISGIRLDTFPNLWDTLSIYKVAI